MKFRAVPVTSLEDVTLDFEQLQTRDILDLTAESVLQVTGGKLGLRSGTASISLAASSTVVTNISLPVAWATSHLGFFPVSVRYGSSLSGVGLVQYGPYNGNTGVASLSLGSVTIINGVTAQTVFVSWVSLGA